MSDEELMSHYCATQDSDAFAELYRRFKDVIKDFLVRSVRDKSSIDDVVQQVFISLWRYREKYREGCSVKTFLFKIASSHSKMAHRDSRVKKRFAGPLVSLTWNPEGRVGAGSNSDPTDASISPPDPMTEALRDIIDALPDEDRVAIECVFVQGMTWGEAAKHLGVARKAFDSHLCRLLRRLRESLTKQDAA